MSTCEICGHGNPIYGKPINPDDLLTILPIRQRQLTRCEKCKDDDMINIDICIVAGCKEQSMHKPPYGKPTWCEDHNKILVETTQFVTNNVTWRHQCRCKSGITVSLVNDQGKRVGCRRCVPEAQRVHFNRYVEKFSSISPVVNAVERLKYQMNCIKKDVTVVILNDLKIACLNTIRELRSITINDRLNSITSGSESIKIFATSIRALIEKEAPIDMSMAVLFNICEQIEPLLPASIPEFESMLKFESAPEFTIKRPKESTD